MWSFEIFTAPLTLEAKQSRKEIDTKELIRAKSLILLCDVFLIATRKILKLSRTFLI